MLTAKETAGFDFSDGEYECGNPAWEVKSPSAASRSDKLYHLGTHGGIRGKFRASGDILNYQPLLAVAVAVALAFSVLGCLPTSGPREFRQQSRDEDIVSYLLSAYEYTSYACN
ncbi:hypothetical protein F5141DRAFT_1067272 [Pisolithus sp. B1]|nr:hypothetical protein F5141DRAFT_1067272 [Pisolithus sp. B1]